MKPLTLYEAHSLLGISQKDFQNVREALRVHPKSAMRPNTYDPIEIGVMMEMGRDVLRWLARGPQYACVAADREREIGERRAEYWRQVQRIRERQLGERQWIKRLQ